MRVEVKMVGLVLLQASIAVCVPVLAAGGSSLSVVEGIVLEVGSRAGEGGLEVVTVRLSTTRPQSREIDLLLAPQSVLEETSFIVEQGDRLKARIFASDDGPAAVHKVLNQSRGSMVRFRTLRQIPLWNGAGVWQGSPGHRGRGGPGQHHPGQGAHGPPR